MSCYSLNASRLVSRLSQKATLFFARSLIILAAMVLFIVSLEPSIAGAQGLSESQMQTYQSGIDYFDDQTCSSSGSTASAVSNVYILGDSITERAETSYSSTFQAQNITTNIDASSSRSLTAPGTDGNKLNGMQAIAADKSQIQQAGAIVVALGTNGGDSTKNIDQAIAAIKADNATAPIYWVDTIGVNGQNFTASANKATNAAIYSQASADGYQVISWFKVVDPSGDPLNPTTPEKDSNGYIDNSDGLGVHPTQAGVSALVNLVVNSVATGQSSAAISSCCNTASSPVNLTGNDNIQKAFNFLVSKGLTAVQAAGVIGNLMQESGMNPTDTQDRKNETTPTPNVGFGIAQWTSAGRQQGLVQLAQQEGVSPTDLGAQLQYLWQELATSYPTVLKSLEQASDVDDATNIFVGPDNIHGQPVAPTDEVQRSGGYEDPSIPYMKNRLNYAQVVLTDYGGSAATNASVADEVSGTSAGGCVTSSNNGSGNFVFYDQCDSKWGNNHFGDGTICSAGCGPTSMAMIISTLTSSSVTPDTVAALTMKDGLYVNGEGTSWSIGPKLAPVYGLKATAVADDVGQISAAIQAGAYVIAPGTGGAPFTGAGHFIVIRAVTSDGNWLLGDPDTAPGHSNTAEWNPAQIVSDIIANGGGGVYAISKE